MKKVYIRYVHNEDTIRIISVRKATRSETREYELRLR